MISTKGEHVVCPSATGGSSLVRCLSKSLACFLTELSSYVEPGQFLHILDFSPLTDTSFENISSQSVACLFIS